MVIRLQLQIEITYLQIQKNKMNYINYITIEKQIQYILLLLLFIEKIQI